LILLGVSWQAKRTPNPTSFFFLIKKTKQKKSRLRPLHSKNLRLTTEILQTPPSGRQTGVFLRRLHLFFGLADEVAR